MSVGWLANVWEHSKATSNELLILLAIADFADKEGKAFPSLKVLAEKSRVSVREAQYCLRHLVEIGELKITAQKRENGSYASNVYMVVLPLVHNMHHPPAQCAPPGARACTTLVHSDAPLNEPSIEPSIKQIPPKPPVNGHYVPLAVSDDFKAFWNEYPRRDAMKDAVRAWNRAHPKLDEVLTALRRAKKTPSWNKGRQYIPLPATWINGERWDDEL